MRNEATSELVDEFIEFLRSFKSAESVSPSLKKEIAVPTRLQECVRNALSDQRVVLITGSAGAGKTHLVEALTAELSASLEILLEPKAIRRPHLLVVKDATELDAERRISILHEGVNSYRVATLMAINEGPLRDAASLDGGEIFKAGVSLLHYGQRGLGKEFDPKYPTVVDIGAFDPLEEEVLAHILGLDIVRQAVHRIAPDPETPRRRAWDQLASGTVRSRVARITKLAKLANPEWLFRDVWDFIADLILEGDDEADPPTSPWYWRLFYGGSSLSRAIREIADPEWFAVPRAEAHLYYGDWNAKSLMLVDDLKLLPLSAPDKRYERVMWLKLQLLVMGPAFDLAAQVLRGGQGRILEASLAGNVSAVLQHINEYITLGLREGPGTRLDLWADHRVERRADFKEGLLRVGQAPAEEFIISRSQVVTNHPDPVDLPVGNHMFLVHRPTNASFALDRGRLKTLATERTLRSADRQHVDLDWDLHQFFEQILSTAISRDEFEIASFKLEDNYISSRKYRVSRAARLIEEA